MAKVGLHAPALQAHLRRWRKWGDLLLVSTEVKKLLEDYGVTGLLSPPYYPRYNGTIEAGIGSLKMHTFYEAARRGRTGYWTADDVEGGRRKANETSRPWGYGGPSPDGRWAGRTMIGCDEWEKFREVLAAERKRWVTAGSRRTRDATQSRRRNRSTVGTDGSSLLPSYAAGENKKRERAAEERMAVTRALVTCGCLTVSKREVPKKAVYA